MTTILLEKIWDSIEFKGILEKEKNSFGDTIVKIHKDSSVLSQGIENAIQEYNQYWSIISKVKFCKVLWEIDYSWSKQFVGKWHHGRNWNGSERIHSIKASIINGIILVVLICYFGRENQVQENQSSLWIDL